MFRISRTYEAFDRSPLVCTYTTVAVTLAVGRWAGDPVVTSLNMTVIVHNVEVAVFQFCSANCEDRGHLLGSIASSSPGCLLVFRSQGLLEIRVVNYVECIV